MSDLAGLVLATAAFVGSHLAMSHPLRVGLVQALGEARFILLFMVVSFLTLGLMILAYGRAPASPVWWIAPDWWWYAAAAILLLASILLVGSLIRNPAFPRPGSPAPVVRPASGVFAVTRHPMNWAFMLWALIHISLWGSPRNLVVAGGILLLALAGSIGQDRKKRALLGRPWREWETRTSFLPFAALLSGRAPWRNAAPDWPALLGGLALWLAVTWYHAPTVSPVVALLGSGG